MPERTVITCKGRVPNTSKTCGAKICETDGVQYFITGQGYEFAVLEIDPPQIRCNVCGFKTKIGQKGAKKSRSLQFSSN